jgi:RNase P subunit RPR2
VPGGRLAIHCVDIAVQNPGLKRQNPGRDPRFRDAPARTESVKSTAPVESPMARRRDKGEERAVAERRIAALLARARAEHLADAGSPLPDRYSGLVLRLAQRYQTGLPGEAKAQLCRACGAYRTGATSRTRLTGGRLSVTCLRCGAVARRPIAPRSPRD